MLELLNFIRPELLITWSCAITLLIVIVINALTNNKKSVNIEYKNSKNQTIGYVEFTSYKL